MDVSNFTNTQKDTLAILLSEGFDYDASYEASIFYSENVTNAREYAKSRSKIPHPNITIQEDNNNIQMSINAICGNSLKYDFSLGKIVITNPKQMTLLYFAEKWHQNEMLEDIRGTF